MSKDKKRNTPQALRERLGEIHDQAAALSNLAESESRELTDDEKKTFDGLMADYKAIQENDLPRAEWLQAEEDRLASARIDARIANGDASGQAGRPLRGPESPDAIASETGIRAAAIKVPPRALAYGGSLRHFTGPYAVQEAYLVGRWIMGAVFNHKPSVTWCLDHGVEIRAAMAGNDNSLGGVLVPDEFAATLIRLVEMYGTFRRKARVWPMASDHTMIPRRAGGVTTYWVGDNASITESNMTLDQVTLTARKLAALVKWSSELDEDAVLRLADLLSFEIGYAFAVKEDQCGFLGTGASTYGGIQGLITACTTATATTVTAITANTAYSTLDLADFEAMIGKLPEFPGIQPEWYISKAGWAASMMRLADAAGGSISDIISGDRRPMFLGYPVNLVQCMNATLTAQTSAKGICYFGDLSMAATMGTRREITLQTTSERYFEYDQLAIKGTERFDINVHDVGDTSVAGAIIMLAMPSS